MRVARVVRGRSTWVVVGLVSVACSGPASTSTDANAIATDPTVSIDTTATDVAGAAAEELWTGEVEIGSVAFPGRLWDPFLPPLDTGRDVTIDGSWTIPAGEERAPAVVLVHGCGGPGGERDWMTVLADHGIASLAVDSFAARGVSEICSGRETVNVSDVVVDAFRAADLAREHPRIDGDRVAVMGFSFGGRTALWSALRRFQIEYGGEPFAAYVAFYPSTCFIQLEDESDVVGGPIRIFHGTADDWTPIAQCDDMIGRITADGVDAAVIRYEGAHHSFDARSLAWAVRHVQPAAVSPRACAFVERDGEIIDPDIGSVAGVDSPCVERGVTLAYDADARAASERDLLAFLDDAFDR